MSLSPELKDAVNHITSHAHGMRAVLVLAEHVGSIEALEQAAAEAENRAISAKADLDKHHAHREQASAEFERVSEANNQLRKDMAELEVQAKAGADAMRADAEKASADIIANAERRAASIAEEARQKAEALDGEIGTRETALAELEVTIAVRSADLAAIEAKVAEAKAYLAKLAEG